MVIIPPHADPAHASQGIPMGIQGAESQQEDSQAEQNGLGVFAKILAGLQGKAGTVTHTATETYDSVAAVGQTEQSQIKDENEKGFPTMAASLMDVVKAKQQGYAEPQPGLSLQSQQEENIRNNLAAFDTGLSPDQLGELATLTAENGEAYLFAGISRATEAAPAADSPRATGETIHPRPMEAATETAQNGPATEQATVRAGELVEKPRNSNENTKNDTGFAAAAREGTDKGIADGPDGYDRGRAGTIADGDRPNVREQRRTYATDARNPGAQTETAHGGANALETRAYGDGNTRDIVLELRTPTQAGASSATTTWEGRPAQGFESMLARELHQHINGDIVRQASLILREGNEGLIRLALRPESLGNVKIHLEMAENKITGYIVVESEEALRAFEREIAALEKEFLEAGFEGAELKMSLSNEGGDQQWNEADEGRLQLAASRYDASAEMTETTLVSFGPGTGVIDVLA